MKQTCTLMLMAGAAFLSSNLLAQSPGSLNTAFGTSGYQILDPTTGFDQSAADVAVQPDGKILVAFTTMAANNNSNLGVMRLNPDGSYDNAFHFDGKYTLDVNPNEEAIGVGLQPDGKIILVGHTETQVSDYDILIHRLNPNGTPDNSFGTNGTMLYDRSGQAKDFAADLVMLPDGRFYVGGTMNILNQVYFLLWRFKANGQPDSTFSSDGNVFENQQTPTAGVYSVAVAPNGSVFLAGGALDGGTIKGVIYKFKSTGFGANSFGGQGVKKFTTGLGKQNIVGGITVRPDGKLVGCGIELNNNTQDENGFLFQLDTVGFFDPSFASIGYTSQGSANSSEAFWQVDLLPSGSPVVLGTIEGGNSSASLLMQFTPSGEIDTSYGTNGGTFIFHNTGSNISTKFAMNNQFLYTAGTIDNNGDNDVFLSSTHIFNNIGLFDFTQNTTAMHVFPNPISTSQMLNVELDAELQGQVSLQLINLSGQVVFANSYYKFSGEQQKKISLQGLARGTYLLTLQCGEKTGTQKILIQ